MYGYPVTCAQGEYSIVQGLPIDDYSRSMMDRTLAELNEEREGVKHLLA
jgi:malate dehydrogenase